MRAQFGLHLQDRKELRDGALETTSVAAKEALRGGGSVKVDPFLELLPKLRNALARRSELKVINVDDEQGFVFRMPVNAWPVWDGSPSAS